MPLYNCPKWSVNSNKLYSPHRFQQATTVVTHGYAPRGIVLPKASHVLVFTGPLNDASAMFRHADRLHNLLRTYSLLTPLDDPQQEENRRVSILEVANNSVECAGLLAWVNNVGRMMETDGESNWDVWVAAFKDAALPLEWAVSVIYSYA
ncbi:ubiquitin carboxyl-terminal hydrolase 48 [Cryptococcus neoformans]|nr:ubiquitin carboxyl-terminal hydrolase 48 [Cryptococcus neoformans var. grubii Bt15]OXH23644.1 ubiquitin carboxyl-terminal hydrolase 48 [Cryptococcus neoformans var. grubii]